MSKDATYEGNMNWNYNQYRYVNDLAYFTLITYKEPLFNEMSIKMRHSARYFLSRCSLGRASFLAFLVLNVDSKYLKRYLSSLRKRSKLEFSIFIGKRTIFTRWDIAQELMISLFTEG